MAARNTLAAAAGASMHDGLFSNVDHGQNFTLSHFGVSLGIPEPAARFGPDNVAGHAAASQPKRVGGSAMPSEQAPAWEHRFTAEMAG